MLIHVLPSTKSPEFTVTCFLNETHKPAWPLINLRPRQKPRTAGPYNKPLENQATAPPPQPPNICICLYFCLYWIMWHVRPFALWNSIVYVLILLLVSHPLTNVYRIQHVSIIGNVSCGTMYSSVNHGSSKSLAVAEFDLIEHFIANAWNNLLSLICYAAQRFKIIRLYVHNCSRFISYWISVTWQVISGSVYVGSTPKYDKFAVWYQSMRACLHSIGRGLSTN